MATASPMPLICHSVADQVLLWLSQEGPHTYRPYLAAVDSDHWLEAEMSSSGMCPPDIPKGYRQTAATRPAGH